MTITKQPRQRLMMKTYASFPSALFVLTCLFLQSCCSCNCPVGWQPHSLSPIFYGHQDYGPEDGAPGHCRVFYPSVDGSPPGAPIQEECCKYPLIILVHGHCDETAHYKKWFLLPAQLARSGYVVAVPEIPNISTHPSAPDHPGVARIGEIREWILNEWEHHDLANPATGLAGHSFGALLAARFAQNNNHIKAYASLSGVWEDWPSGARPVESLDMPMLFCRGDGVGDLFTRIDFMWDNLAVPRHQAVFTDAHHWDYLQAGSSICEHQTLGRGPCSKIPILSTELVTMFFTKYLRRSSSPDNRIPDSLIPPELTLTDEQKFFAGGGYLMSFDNLGNDCQVRDMWVTNEGSGTLELP